MVTDAAIPFFSEVQNGNQSPDLGYEGVRYKPDVKDLLATLLHYMATGKLELLPVELEPKSLEYARLKNLLIHVHHIRNDPAFKDCKVSSVIVNSSNTTLVQ